MTPGALLLRLSERLKGGPVASFYREVVRPRILRTPPVLGTSDETAEIHVLTRSQDWMDLVWALKSFYRVTRRRYRLCIHDDGSLSPRQREVLEWHFPAGRLIGRADADRALEDRLTRFPRCLAFRRTNVLAPKVLDFLAFLESDRMLVFDSDLLFFEEPSALLDCVDNEAFTRNLFNADFASAYTVTPQVAQQEAEVDLLPCVNSGLGLVHGKSMALEWVEEFLALPGVLEGHPWRIEQTLMALCSSRYGVDLLPAEYTLSLEPGLQGRPFRHYVGAIRPLMYGEGMRSLRRQGLLRTDT